MAVSDWKTKYLDMRAKLLESTDVAYRLGYADGMKDGQQAAQQQQMEAQMAAQAQAEAQANGELPPEEGGDMAAQGMEEGAVPPEAGMEDAEMGGMPPQMEEGDGSELDQHINELESLVAKGEKPSVLSMRKAVQALADLRKSQKTKWTKKVEKESSSQKKFVDGLLKKWESESKTDVTDGLEETLKEHGIKFEE